MNTADLSASSQYVRFQQNDTLMSLLASQRQTSVKCHQGSASHLADPNQIAIPQCFRRRQAGKWSSGGTKGPIEIQRLMPDPDTRIFQPSVVHFPCFANGPHVLSHHRGCRKQPQQPDLREPAKEEPIAVLPGEPIPRAIGVHMIGPAQGQPHVEIRQIRCRTDSPCQDCPPRACPSCRPEVPSRVAMAVAETSSLWRW